MPAARLKVLARVYTDVELGMECLIMKIKMRDKLLVIM